MKIVKKSYKKLFLSSVVLIFTLLGGVTYATFYDKGDILGSSFSVASSDIKILLDYSKGLEQSNLVDEIQGPVFDNIKPYWEGEYLFKIYNNGSEDLNIISNSEYETANDIEDLRQIIYVEAIEWVDSNDDGIATEDELTNSYGIKNIVKWKSEGLDLGIIEKGNTKGILLKFSTLDITNSKQGAIATFDFILSSSSAN